MEKIIEMVKEAYVKVMGVEKWNGLTDAQKHDVIMIMAKNLDNAIAQVN